MSKILLFAISVSFLVFGKITEARNWQVGVTGDQDEKLGLYFGLKIREGSTPKLTMKSLERPYKANYLWKSSNYYNDLMGSTGNVQLIGRSSIDKKNDVLISRMRPWSFGISLGPPDDAAAAYSSGYSVKIEATANVEGLEYNPFSASAEGTKTYYSIVMCSESGKGRRILKDPQGKRFDYACIFQKGVLKQAGSMTGALEDVHHVITGGDESSAGIITVSTAITQTTAYAFMPEILGMGGSYASAEAAKKALMDLRGASYAKPYKWPSLPKKVKGANLEFSSNVHLTFKVEK